METNLINIKKTKPIIGIVTKHYLKNSVRPDMYIRDKVKQAIYDNGGIAIGITFPRDELLYGKNMQMKVTKKLKIYEKSYIK